ncbi:hypothetical protein SLS58_007422 [Diplodia intermedia]|uniref:DUF7730 domain-containing protein n=1 Tax=Diplodia intermedia TaxID=856260 RepID=A0ABR3TKG8_9PEZI
MRSGDTGTQYATVLFHDSFMVEDRPSGPYYKVSIQGCISGSGSIRKSAYARGNTGTQYATVLFHDSFKNGGLPSAEVIRDCFRSSSARCDEKASDNINAFAMTHERGGNVGPVRSIVQDPRTRCVLARRGLGRAAMDNSSSPPRDDNQPTEQAMDDKIEAQVNSEVEVQGNNGIQDNQEVNLTQRQQPQGSLWAKLPAELRNQIYEYLLKVNYEIFPGAREPSGNSLMNRSGTCWCRSCGSELSCLKCIDLVPKVLRLNKEIYNEAVGVLYDHELHFWDVEDLELFVKTRRPGSTVHPRSITINMRDPHWEVFLHLMGCAVGDFQDGVSQEAQDVAPHAFDLFSGIADYIKSLNGETVDDSVFTLDFEFTRHTHPLHAGDDWRFVVVPTFVEAVSAKLEELAPNRKFLVAGIVNDYYDGDELDGKYYQEQDRWLLEWFGDAAVNRRSYF